MMVHEDNLPEGEAWLEAILSGKFVRKCCVINMIIII